METDYDTDEMETDDSTPLSLTTLPSELLLGCCSFLDAWGLGRLELCARSSLGEEADRAWKQLTAGVPRGDLTGCSSKRFAIAHARARELFPNSCGEVYNRLPAPMQPKELRITYEEFVFSWGFFWRDGDSLQSALFEHLTLCHEQDNPALPAFALYISGDAYCVPVDALGHAMLSPHLKRSQEYVKYVGARLEADSGEFKDSWSPVAVLICTRRRDGAAAEVCRFEGLDGDDINSMVSSEEPYGSLCLDNASFNLPLLLKYLISNSYRERLGSEVGYAEQIQSSTTLVFDESTGQLRYIFTGFYDDNGIEVPHQIIRTILHGLCDEAVRG